jgi:hypothetical protein
MCKFGFFLIIDFILYAFMPSHCLNIQTEEKDEKSTEIDRKYFIGKKRIRNKTKFIRKKLERD